MAEPAPAAEPPAVEEPTEQAPEPAPVPAPIPPKALPQPDAALVDEALEAVFFSGVEKWEDGLPAGWSSADDLRGVSQKDAGRSGKASVQLDATDGWAYIARNFDVDAPFEGGVDYVIDAYLKGSTPESATLRFVCFAGEDRYEAEAVSTGQTDDEGWERLALPVTVPESLEIDRYQIRIFRAPGEGDPLFVDDVSVLTLPASEDEAAE